MFLATYVAIYILVASYFKHDYNNYCFCINEFLISVP